MSYNNPGRRASRYKDKFDEADRWHPSHSQSSSLSDDFDYPAKKHKQSMFESPRFKRGLLLATVLFLLTIGAYQQLYLPWQNARMAEAAEQQAALDLEAEDVAVEESARLGPTLGNQEAHKPVDFDRLVLVQDMDEKHIPGVTKGGKNGKSSAGRLIVIGDVHGMKEQLVKLLDKVDFDKKKDHLVFAGDLISKGPDSEGVVELAMEVGADAVRGNHEDRMLLAYDAMGSALNSFAPTDLPIDPQEREDKLQELGIATHKDEHKDRKLARKFNAKQISWLKNLPIILRVGYLEGMGEVIVVHGGLVPGLKLERQDPYAVMNMRSIDLKTHVPSDLHTGTWWTKLWNAYQRLQSKHKRTTVIYGHDARRSLQITDYTKGLDSSCLRGGQLTAYVIESGEKEVKQSIVQVDCPDKNPKT